MTRESVTSHPLYWPAGWKRAKHRTRSAFGRCSMDRVSQDTLRELDLMGCNLRNVVISTNVALRLDGLPYANQRAPDDPGAAVWFNQGGEARVLACDRWDLVEHNLRAIAKHVAAIRGQTRWGVGSLEQAFKGYTALPAGKVKREWWDVLEVRPDASPNVIKANYRRRALDCHPDRGGSRETWNELAAAYTQGLEAVGA